MTVVIGVDHEGVEVKSRVELFAAIRRDARMEELSIPELAERHQVHRRTVRQALASAILPPRKVPVRTARVLEELKPVTDAMLRTDLVWRRRASSGIPPVGCGSDCGT